MKLPADLVVVGKGVRPNTEPFLTSGLAIRRGILVDEHLETNLSGVNAAGDVAEAADVWKYCPRFAQRGNSIGLIAHST